VTKRTTKEFICVDKKYGKEVEENYKNKELETMGGRGGTGENMEKQKVI
jgi:hypothetical protein